MTPPLRRTVERSRVPAWWLVVALVVAGLAVPFLAGQAPLDLQVYLAGGQAVRHGVGLYGGGVDVRGYGFTYPPFAALLFAPLSMLRFGGAVTVSLVVSLLCLVGVLRVSLREIGLRLESTLSMLLVVVAALFCEPVRVNVWNGQVNLVLLGLLAVDQVLPPSSRWRGVATGVAAAVKLTPALFVVLLLVQRDWRSAARAVGSGLVCSAVAAVALPTDSRHFWAHGLFDKDNIGDTASSNNQSLYAVAERGLGSESMARPVWIVAAAIVLVVGGVVVRRLLRSEQRLLAWSLTGVVACLVSPVAWTHHWVWCVPLLAALWPVLTATRGGRVAWWALAVLFAIGTNKPPFSWSFHSPVGRVVFGNGYVWASLTLLGWLFVQGRRERVTGVTNMLGTSG